jgi:hypothetical protein
MLTTLFITVAWSSISDKVNYFPFTIFDFGLPFDLLYAHLHDSAYVCIYIYIYIYIKAARTRSIYKMTKSRGSARKGER